MYMHISTCTVVRLGSPSRMHIPYTVCMYVCMKKFKFILCLRVEKEREMAEQKMLSEDPRHKRDPKYVVFLVHNQEAR